MLEVVLGSELSELGGLERHVVGHYGNGQAMTSERASITFL